jgi:hypothetical protein
VAKIHQTGENWEKPTISKNLNIKFMSDFLRFNQMSLRE